MIVHEAQQPVIPVMTELATRKPLRDETAPIFRCQRLRLVHPDVTGIKHLAVEVFPFDDVAVYQGDVIRRLQQTKGGNDGRANASAADNVVHVFSFRDAAMILPSLLGGFVSCWYRSSARRARETIRERSASFSNCANFSS